MGNSFRLTARVLLYAQSYRQDSTYHGLCYTSRGALAGTRNSSSVVDLGRAHGPNNYFYIVFTPPPPTRYKILYPPLGVIVQAFSIGCESHLLHMPFFMTINYFDNCVGSSDRSFIVDPLSYFSFQPVLHDWCNKGRGMC